MTHQERQELNDLSKQCFGTKSRWQKICDYGVIDTMSRDREVVIPGPSGLKTQIFTDQKFVTKHYSVEEVKKLMTEILADRVKHTVVQEVPAEASLQSDK
jgi:hypothetical protein